VHEPTCQLQPAEQQRRMSPFPAVRLTSIHMECCSADAVLRPHLQARKSREEPHPSIAPGHAAAAPFFAVPMPSSPSSTFCFSIRPRELNDRERGDPTSRRAMPHGAIVDALAAPEPGRDPSGASRCFPASLTCLGLWMDATCAGRPIDAVNARAHAPPRCPYRELRIQHHVSRCGHGRLGWTEPLEP
jgi:hypothetical protein